MDEAVNLLEECIKIDPDRATAYFELSQIVSFQGDQKKAEKLAVKAATIEDENSWLLVYCGGLFAK